MVLGTIVFFGAIPLFVWDYLSWHMEVAVEFAGLLVLGYGVKLLRDRTSVRGLWRNGQITPGLVIGRARLPYVGVVAYSTLVAAAVSLDSIYDLHWAYLVGVLVVGVIFERTSRWLNSADVFVVLDNEPAHARLPVNGLWRRLEVGDCVWVARQGDRIAVLHMAAPITPDEAMADEAASEWISARIDELDDDEED